MKRLPLALLALLVAVPMLGGAISHDVTLPVAGKILLPGDGFDRRARSSAHDSVRYAPRETTQ